MSKVDNLKAAGQAVGELGAVVVGVVANGTNYLADLVMLPQLVKAGEDAANAVKSYQADLDEVKNLDEAGRADVAAAWQAAIPALVGKPVEDVLTEGVTVVTYGLEALGYFLRTWKPAA